MHVTILKGFSISCAHTIFVSWFFDRLFIEFHCKQKNLEFIIECNALKKFPRKTVSSTSSLLQFIGFQFSLQILMLKACQ